MRGSSVLLSLLLLLGLPVGPMQARAAAGETVDEALCRLIDAAAGERGLPVAFFAKLIWRDSAFRAAVVSPKGAQGVAQFMPATAQERGLADPFDPQQAIPEAARLLADLRTAFGNLGLAAAAYNAGAGRVSDWLATGKGLPEETRRYVAAITGRSAEDWAVHRADPSTEEGAGVGAPHCAQVTAELRRGRASGPEGIDTASDPDFAPLAPWGVQLAGNFSKMVALHAYSRMATHYAQLLGDLRPMVIGTRLRNRGFRPFFRIRVPARTRLEADSLCRRIHGQGGSCIVLKS